MTPDDYRRAGDLFDQLRQLPEPDRAIALDSACNENAELRAQVARMFAAESQAEQRRLPGATRDRGRSPAFSLHELRKSLTPGPSLETIAWDPVSARAGMGSSLKGGTCAWPPCRDQSSFPSVRPSKGQNAPAASSANPRHFIGESPNIVSIFDAAFDHGHYYIAMEFVEGKTAAPTHRFRNRGRSTRKPSSTSSGDRVALSRGSTKPVVQRNRRDNRIMGAAAERQGAGLWSG